MAQLRERLGEIPTDKKVVLICDSGFTSYLASRVLLQNGFNNVYSLMGGIKLNKVNNKKKEVAMALSSTNILKIDACGLQCPGPIMKISEKINEIENGEIIEILSTDKGFKSDIEAWCDTTGNTLIGLNNENKTIKAVIQKGELKTLNNTQNIKNI